MDEKVEIYNDGNNFLELKKLFVVENYITFMLNIDVGDFSGAHSFCMSNDDLNVAIDILKKIDENLEGELLLSDYDSESYLLLQCEGEKVFIKGQLGSQFEDNILVFRKIMDQTIIRLLISCLCSFLIEK